jgi:uncharacterized protein
VTRPFRQLRRGAAIVLGTSWLAAAAALAALEVPFLEGRVNDLAGILDAADEDRIERKLADFEREKGSQVAVLTLPSLEGDNLEDFSIRVVETWKLGRAGVDDGVLLLVAQKERQLRLEVGYGLEGVLPDALARRIVANVITPRFREGDFTGGIEAGVDTVLQAIRGEALPPRVVAERRTGGAGVLVLILLVILLFFLISLIRGWRRLRRGGGTNWSSRRGGGRGTPWIFTTGSGSGSSWGGGSRSSWGGGGGFGGFSGGGGGFGGGGASGKW